MVTLSDELDDYFRPPTFSNISVKIVCQQCDSLFHIMFIIHDVTMKINWFALFTTWESDGNFVYLPWSMQWYRVARPSRRLDHRLKKKKMLKLTYFISQKVLVQYDYKGEIE